VTSILPLLLLRGVGFGKINYMGRLLN